MPVVNPPGESSNPGPGGTAKLPVASLPTTGPVTPLEIYELLLNAGYSTNQAIGIMANAINESQLDPEAVGDGGTSFGFVQFHQPGYAGASSLVTGNPQQDIRAQIVYLAQHVSSGAVAGATPADVAGNFAANFEKCVGCQPGGAQYVSRVGNAAKVAGWVASGAWPQSSGSGGGPGNAPASSDPGCMIQFPGVLGIGSFCLFRSSWARGMIGGLLLSTAVPVGLVGAIVLAALGFRASGAGVAVGRTAEAAGGAIALVPGLEGAGAAVAAAGSVEARSAKRAKSERDQRAQDRHDERVAREVEGRRRDSAKGPALRDEEPVPF